MKSLVFIVLFTNIYFSTEAGKILALQLIATPSYGNVMRSIIKNLAKNHEIVYYSITDKKIEFPNITLVSVPRPEHIYMEHENVFKKMLIQDDTSEDAINVITSLNADYVKFFLSSDMFQKLMNTKEKFDALLMCYSLSEFILPLAHHLNIPLIQVSTSTPFPWQNDAIGNPNFFSYDNSMFTPEIPDNFYNRLIKFIKHVRISIYYQNHYLPSMNKIIKKYFPNTPPIENLSKKTSLLLVNTVEAMGYSKPVLSNYVEIGGLHCGPPKALPNDLQEFIESSEEHGVIYFSLGSTMQVQMPEYITQIFINVFKKLPQKIIWKFNGDMKDLPENIMALQWCPQQDILGHNKTRLFITQGGILSLQESIYHGVPVLVLPIILDQPSNAKTVQKVGYGRYLPLSKFSEETLEKEIKEILTQPKYQMKAKKISSLMKDIPMSASNKLTWWINYIIRHKGFPIYRPNDDRYSWVKNINTDIFLFIQFCIIVTLIITIIIIKLICKYLLIRNKTKIS